MSADHYYNNEDDFYDDEESDVKEVDLGIPYRREFMEAAKGVGTPSVGAPMILTAAVAPLPAAIITTPAGTLTTLVLDDKVGATLVKPLLGRVGRPISWNSNNL